MAICAKYVADPGNPSGPPMLVMAPYDPPDPAVCAVVISQIGDNSFALSAEDGGLISSGIISVWLAAFGIKAVINVIRGSSHENS